VFLKKKKRKKPHFTKLKKVGKIKIVPSTHMISPFSCG
jgi:hypothetical protein